MEKLQNIEASLEQLHKEFNKQVEALSTDTKEFHNSLIELSSKYPEHRELIQFIVFINDKLETNQSLFGDIIVEAFNDLVESKRTLVREIILEKEKKKPNCINRAILKMSNLKDIKVILIATTTIIILIGMAIDSAAVLAFLKTFLGLLKV